MAMEFKLFVASPGDVKAERDSLDAVVNEINTIHGEELGYQLQLVRWETNCVPGAGRPQQVINDQIGGYDLFLGIMWRRFGTPTGVAESGTEEEFRIAYSAWEEKKVLDLMFYFCKKPFMPSTIEELDQMRNVLKFRKELEGKAIVWDYNDEQDFPNVIRRHLCKRLNRAIKERKGGKVYKTMPDDNALMILRDIWPKMDSELQRAISIAYNENRLKGDAGIQTSDLFAALINVGQPELKLIVDEIPQAALPEPTEGPVTDEPYVIAERPWLSHCVASSFQRLNNQIPSDRMLSSADIFADIAKHGTGQSVALLRKNNVGPDEINRIIKNKNLQLVGM